jgi:hypothetical protein
MINTEEAETRRQKNNIFFQITTDTETCRQKNDMFQIKRRLARKTIAVFEETFFFFWGGGEMNFFCGEENCLTEKEQFFFLHVGMCM